MRRQALTHDDVAGGTSCAHVAGVLNVDFVFEQRFTNGRASWRADLGALGAVFGVGENFNNWHGARTVQRWCDGGFKLVQTDSIFLPDKAF